METYCNEIYQHQKRFFKLMRKDKTVQKQIKKYGDLSTFPFGMSNYVAFPKKSTASYSFDKDKNGRRKINPEYPEMKRIILKAPIGKTFRIFI